MISIKKSILLFSIFVFSQNAIAQPLNGIKTIGASGANYASISLAIKDLKAKGVDGKLTFKIKSGTYTEKFIIPPITGVNAINTVTMESETGKAVDVTINNSTPHTWGTHGTMNLEGAEYFTFNNLTFKTGAPEIASCVQIRKSSSNITFDGCKFEVTQDDNGGLSAGIAAADSAGCPTTIVAGGLTVEKLIVKNCTFVNGSYGVIIAGKLTAGFNVIENNTFTNVNGYGIYLSDNKRNIVNKNSISMEPNGAGMYGMYLSSVDSTNISNNYIKGADAYGIYFSSADRNLVYNNIIGGGFARKGTGGYGFYISANGNKFYHNSVLYDALSGTTTGLISACVYLSSVGNHFYNNNFINTGGGFVYYVSGTKDLLANSDNNNLYVSAGGFISRFTSPATDNDFAAHKAFTKQDAASVNVLPVFAGAFDLHLKVDNKNKPLDGSGTPTVGITTDFDGQERNALKPDMGADEFSMDLYDFALLDANPRKAKLGNNKVTVTIGNNGINSLKDSAINLTYSVDGGLSWVPTEKFTSKTLLKFGDQEVFEFATAWDVSEFKSYQLKVKIEPSLNSDNVKTNDTLTVNSCVLIAAGAYDLGPNAPVFKNLNSTIYTLTSNCGIDGPVVFNLESGTYSETVVMGVVTGTSATNTITFQSKSGNADDVIIKGGSNSDFNHYVFRFKGAKNVILKNLTIQNDGTDFASGVNVISASRGITVDNCKFKMKPGIKNSYIYGVLLSGIEDINSKSVAENILIQNSNFDGGNVGVKLQGDSLSSFSGNEIVNNTMQNISNYGVYSENLRLKTISKNSITLNDNNERSQGIYVFNSKLSNLTIDANKLVNGGMYLSKLKSDEGGNVLVSNNMLCGVSKNKLSSDLFFTNLCENLLIYHNSLSFKNDDLSTTGAAMHIESGVFIELINNIFKSDANAYNIKVDDGVTGVYACDNNNYFSTGSKFAYWNGEANNLSELQSKSAKNASSISVDPSFISQSDLHTLNGKLDGKGLGLEKVPNDFDGQPRNPNTPDIGCDEFTNGLDASLNKWVNPLANDQVKLGSALNLSVEIGNAGSAEITGFDVTYTINGGTPVDEKFTGTIVPSASRNYNFTTSWTPLDTGKITLCAKVKMTGDLNASNDEQCIFVEVIKGLGYQNNVPNSNIVEVYPNPFKDFIDLNIKNQKHSVLKIFNVLGETVFQKEIKNTQEIIQLSYLTKGTYVLEYGQYRTLLVKN